MPRPPRRGRLQAAARRHAKPSHPWPSSAATPRRAAESALPLDTRQRLAALFKRRDTWTEDDITPYIEYALAPGF